MLIDISWPLINNPVNACVDPLFNAALILWQHVQVEAIRMDGKSFPVGFTNVTKSVV